MNTPRIDWPASVSTAPAGYKFGAHTTVPGGEAYHLIREADDRSILAVQRPDLDEDDAPDSEALDELLGAVEVTVGAVKREHGEPAEYAAYVSVEVTVGGHACQVGAMVGAREHLWGSIEAAGCGVRPHLSVWWEDGNDGSDWGSLPAGTRDIVLDAMLAEKARLWAEVQELRA
jgi:hypothetical protein